MIPVCALCAQPIAPDVVAAVDLRSDTPCHIRCLRWSIAGPVFTAGVIFGAVLAAVWVRVC